MWYQLTDDQFQIFTMTCLGLKSSFGMTLAKALGLAARSLNDINKTAVVWTVYTSEPVQDLEQHLSQVLNGPMQKCSKTVSIN